MIATSIPVTSGGQRTRVSPLLALGATIYCGLTGAEASAQSVVRLHGGPFVSGGVTIVRGMDDVNGDGVSDYMTGRWISAGTSDRVIKVYSGLDGHQIYGIPEAIPGTGVGSILDGGFDATGDGIGDIIAGVLSTPLPNGSLASYGSVRIYSGADGALIRTQVGPMLTDDDFGYAVRWVGDLNGDLRSEYAVGETQLNQSGNMPRVWVFDGATGATVSVSTSNVKDGYGFDLEVMSDVDGDGTSELLVGAPGHTVGGVASAGAVFVVNPRTGAQLNVVPGSTQLVGVYSDVFGWSITNVGDVTGDGLPEVAGSYGGFGIRVVGAMTGATVTDIPTPEVINNVLGAQLDTTDDLDGDGYDDLLASIWSGDLNDPRGLLVIGSRSGEWIEHRPDTYSVSAAPVVFYNFPQSIASLGDLDGDGRRECAISHGSAPIPNTNKAGVVEVLNLAPLAANTQVLTPANGMKVDLQLSGGLQHLGNQYFVLASITGTTGIPLGGGFSPTLPLTYDFVTDISIGFANTAVFQNTFATLNTVDGIAHATFDGSFLPLAADGLQIHFAYVGVQQNGNYWVSNPETITVDF